MICFPNAKINIGLNITSKRADGFHDIETIFYPIQLADILEFTESKQQQTNITSSGIELDIPSEKNICYKAYQLLQAEYNLPPLEIFLHKIIPSGAGLGGGSSDAAFLLKELNAFFKLGLSDEKLEEKVAQIGSDCAFFIKNKPVFAYGRGEKFKPIELDLSKYYIYLVKPEIFVSTPEAFAGVQPAIPQNSLLDLIKLPVEKWKDYIFNDFEASIFKKHPLLNKIKLGLYNQGAIYAAMSGSGSSLFGIFEEEPRENPEFTTHFNWIGQL